MSACFRMPRALERRVLLPISGGGADEGFRRRVQEVRPFEQLLDRNVQRFRGGLVFKAHRRCVSGLRVVVEEGCDLSKRAAHLGRRLQEERRVDPEVATLL